MSLDEEKVVFLLGGHDLEMIAIRGLLKDKGYKLFDESQKWGAKLSAYQKKIDENPNSIFYGIELEEDIELPKYYHKIDHHGKDSDKPSSLFQVLQLLNIEPNRDQELISANDTGYIDGMKKICANNDEIKDIRRRDIEAQGIKQEDEILVKKSIERCKREENGIVIVKIDSSHFSVIRDILYFKHNATKKVIIYNDKKSVFYGFGNSVLKEFFQKQEIEDSKYYYGGGECGYFGIKDEHVDKELLERLIEKVIDLEKVPYSSHIFMFPFRFDYGYEKSKQSEFDFYKDKKLAERVRLDELNKKLENSQWEYEKFDIDRDEQEKHLLYNEFGYFYDYVRDALYNDKGFNKDSISNFYRKKQDDTRGKIFEIKTRNKGCFQLDIEGVTLRVFKTGVAILSIELANYCYKDFKDILVINDFGRRIYPQFIGKCGVNDIKDNNLLAESITIKDADKIYTKEDFEGLDYKDIHIGNHIMYFLDDDIFSHKKEEIDKFYIQPSLDDRMFVLSWYANDDLSNELKTCCSYKNSDKWYEYVFIDGDGTTVQNSSMKEELLKEATYDRWSGFGTLYGFSRYSFVCLTDEDYFGKYIVRNHIQTMYFQMAILLLANRTSILRFSDEISALASDDDFDVKKLTELYKRYLIFYNRLYFKELTHQDQGIEIYDKALKQMKISEHIEKLDGKFTKLFEFADLQEEKERNGVLDSLTILGATFLPATTFVTVHMMDSSIVKDCLFIVTFILTLISLLILSKIKEKKLLVGVGALISGVVLVLSLKSFFDAPKEKIQKVHIVKDIKQSTKKSMKGKTSE